jgi:hypothetical protein
MINVVLPIYRGDLHLALPLLRRLASWRGELQEHHFAMLCCWEDKFDIEPLAKDMSELFKNFRFQVIPDVPEFGGWPDAANHMFYHAARWCAGEAFYWFEADNFPLRPCFLDDLEKEYSESGKPYMGVINVSRWQMPDGKTEERGQHMVGTGIYPKDFLSVCKSIHFVPEGIPWDVYIGEEVVPQCHDTKLIHHAWGTCNYRLEDGVLNCDNFEPKPGNHLYARPVGKDAVVIHGDKSASLYKLLK